MADLSDLQAAQTVKIVGSDATGVEQTPVNSTIDGRLMVEAVISNAQLIQVSSDDQTYGYLEGKVAGQAGKVTVTTNNPGGAETLQIGLATTGVTPGTYGNSAKVPVITVNNTGQITTVSTVAVDELYDHWNGTTQYNGSQLRKYTNTLTTDANGRITLALTQTGIAGGTALFTSLLSIQATGQTASTDPLQAPLFFVESATATQVVIRGVRGTSTSVLIGGTINSAQYVGSGITARVEITGVKP